MIKNVQITNESETIQFDVHLLVQVETTNGLSRWFEFITAKHIIEHYLFFSGLSSEVYVDYKTHFYDELVRIASIPENQVDGDFCSVALRYLCCYKEMSLVNHQHDAESIQVAAYIKRDSESSTEIHFLDRESYRKLRNEIY